MFASKELLQNILKVNKLIYEKVFERIFHKKIFVITYNLIVC